VSDEKCHIQQVKLDATKSDEGATIPYAGNDTDSLGGNDTAAEESTERKAVQSKDGKTGARFG